MLTSFIRLIVDRTTIPIPRVIASCIDEDPSPLSTFIILEYIEGEKLLLSKFYSLSDEHRHNLYVTLAQIYIQLRRLEFSSLGCLVRRGDEFEARKMPASIDINMLDLEGLHPLGIMNRYYHGEPLTSASSYIKMLLDIADSSFAESQEQMEPDLVEEKLYNLNLFREFTHSWIDPRLDQGPFLLSHGDLQCFNLIVGPDFKVTVLLDWEWGCVVPRQLFTPPLWLKYPDLTLLALPPIYEQYIAALDEFLDKVRSEERKMYGNTMLADEWDAAKQNGGFLVANALENKSHIDWVSHRYITTQLHGCEGLEGRVRAFMDENSHLARVVARKSKSFRATYDEPKDIQDGEQGELQ